MTSRDPTSRSSPATTEPMIVVPVRMPVVQRDALDDLVARVGDGMDRSKLIRQMLADGIRRATAAANHPSLLPPELRPPVERS